MQIYNDYWQWQQRNDKVEWESSGPVIVIVALMGKKRKERGVNRFCLLLSLVVVFEEPSSRGIFAGREFSYPRTWSIYLFVHLACLCHVTRWKTGARTTLFNDNKVEENNINYKTPPSDVVPCVFVGRRRPPPPPTPPRHLHVTYSIQTLVCILRTCHPLQTFNAHPRIMF